jgi:prepilin-type N-terminal cleavage/methylation domain-containing protein/prepilin-type processing-associated H-X9-DG protein
MKKLKGFTLIELLVVIAIIALLLSVILPSLRAAKELASGVVCQNNEKQLCLAWVSYAEDNDSYIVGGSNYHAWKPTPYRWVEYPMNDDGSWSADPGELSLHTRLNGIRAGRLFPYTQDEELYHCPGDRAITNAEPEATYRSYSISGLINGEDYASKSGGTFTYRTAVTAPGGTPKELKLVTKTNQITLPGNKYVFVEEEARGQHVNAGSFVLLSGSAYNWWDAPAYYHNDSSTIGFADGHAERHKWRDKDTIQLMKTGRPDPDPLKNEDLHWMVRGYLPR